MLLKISKSGNMEKEGEKGHKKGVEIDFYVIIDYKKMRGVRIVKMEDGNGDVDNCLVVPMLKNGIKDWGRDKWRVIFGAFKASRDENASHLLVPQIEDAVRRGMYKQGYIQKYRFAAPIVGDVVPDITKIPVPPTFPENSTSYKEMIENMTGNPDGGLIAVETKISPDVDASGRKHMTEAQKKMREMLLNRTKGDPND